MPELNFPPGYRLGDNDEYLILQRAPLSESVNNSFSEVYLARKVKTRKKYAVKVLRPDIIKRYKRVIEDFQDEIRFLMKLEHKHIIKIGDYGLVKDADGIPSFYLIMEFIENSDILDEGYSLRKQINFGIQILNGIEYLHDNGILHRDIKPDNLLVYQQSVVKITDFGIAKFVEEESPVSSVIGAPAYASPEQMSKEKKVDFRSDVYSFGKTLYSMITKRVPDVGGEITCLPDVCSEIPGADQILSIIKKATKIEPEKRYQSAHEINIELKKLYYSLFFKHEKAKTIIFKNRKEKQTGSGIKKKILIPIFITFMVVILAGIINRSDRSELSSLKNLFAVNSKKSYIKSEFEVAQDLFRLGPEKFGKSQLIFENVLKREPENISVYPFLGAIYSYRNEYDNLINLWKQALTYFPDNEMIIINLGKSYYEAGDYMNALSTWKKKERSMVIQELIDVVTRNQKLLN